MSENDLIRRGDALEAIQLGETVTKLQSRIATIPAVDAEPVCTCCGGTGITYQTERRCACLGPDLTDPVVVHANMLRGSIAKPTVEQIVHLYGVDALTAALAPMIVREAAPYMTDLMVDPEEIPDMEMEYDHRAGDDDDE